MEIVFIICTLIAPVLAVQAQKWIERFAALNKIEFTFDEPKVIHSWREYFETLTQDAPDIGQRRIDKFVNLLYEMSQCLHYNFDKPYLKNYIYSPIYFTTIENEQIEHRKLMLDVLRGNRPLVIAAWQQQQGTLPQAAPPRADELHPTPPPKV